MIPLTKAPFSIKFSRSETEKLLMTTKIQASGLLGSMLVEEGLITEEQLRAALFVQDEEKAKPLGQILIEQNFITEEVLAKVLALQKHLEVVDLDEYEIDVGAANIIDETLARRNGLIPIAFQNGRLLVAIANPLDVYAVDTVQLSTGLRVELVVATASSISEAITNYMGNSANLQETLDEAAKASKPAAPRIKIEDE